MEEFSGTRKHRFFEKVTKEREVKSWGDGRNCWRKMQVIKLRKEKSKLVVCEDVSLDQIV